MEQPKKKVNLTLKVKNSKFKNIFREFCKKKIHYNKNKYYLWKRKKKNYFVILI